MARILFILLTFVFTYDSFAQLFVERSVVNSSGQTSNPGFNKLISSFGEPVADMEVNTQSGFIQVFSPVIIIEVKEYESDLAIYPNPFLTEVLIRSDDQLESVIVYDFQGKVIYRSALSENEYRLTLNDLPTGIYLVNVSLSNGSVLTRKIVKSR